MLVQRGRNNTVTTIPILIPCSRDEQQGEATFTEFTQPVRELTDKDFEAKTGRGSEFLGSMQEDERLHFAGVVGLMKAIEQHDPIAAAKARKRLSEVRAAEARRAKKEPTERDLQYGQLMAPYVGLGLRQEREALEILNGYRLPPRIAEREAKVLSLEISRKLALWVNVVLWWTGERFTPALYCTDPKLATYVYILTHKRWSICPHCGKFFVQQRSDQNYCSVAHREAHRVARWRAAQIAKSRKKGSKHGTRKARQNVAHTFFR